MLQGAADYKGEVATAHAYAQALPTLLIAYSCLGTKTLDGAPANEPRFSNTTRYIECPLDVLMRYYYRVLDRVMRLRTVAALAWVRCHDEAQRTMLVDCDRNSTDKFETIV